MRDLFSDVTTVTLAKCLDAAAIKHQVIANNIANVETPGFARSEVGFEAKLREALELGSRDAILERVTKINPEPQLDRTSPARPDGNNVIIDREMADLTRNSLQYDALVQLINLKGNMLRTVITEGRR